MTLALSQELADVMSRIREIAGDHPGVKREHETLAALCEVLECQPGDLLRWEPPSD